jgi:iron(III) transport system substrate-binding protein
MWLVRFLTVISGLVIVTACTRAPREITAGRGGTVVVYVSEDQVFSEPVLKDFEKDTGIQVRAVYDTEETKSTGVMNRLTAEKDNPQADVYWANEPIRAEVLKQQGISTPYKSANADGIADHFKDPQAYWTGFSARARVFVINKKLGNKRPGSFADYASPGFRRQGVIANPLFGTTTAYMAAVFTVLGDDKAKQLLDRIKSNDVKISTSNGESADLVSSGEFGFSLVDSDDAFSRIKQGRPIEIVYPDQSVAGWGCMIIPNAVVLIKEGPNPENAKRLIDYLLSNETERKLAFSDAAQIPLHRGVDTPELVPRIEKLKAMQVNYGEVARKMQEIQPYLKAWAAP